MIKNLEDLNWENKEDRSVLANLIIDKMSKEEMEEHIFLVEMNLLKEDIDYFNSVLEEFVQEEKEHI